MKKTSYLFLLDLRNFILSGDEGFLLIQPILANLKHPKHEGTAIVQVLQSPLINLVSNNFHSRYNTFMSQIIQSFFKKNKNM